MNLDEIRSEIDSLDGELVELIKRRMECSKRVAEYKRANGKPVFDAQREQAIIDKLSQSSGEYATAIEAIWQTMMGQSRALQYPYVDSRSVTDFEVAEDKSEVKSVACQGIEGAYSVIVARQLYPNADIEFCATWDEVCRKVKSGEVEYGILPVENSSAGSVHDVYDLLIGGKLYIAHCVDAKISHNLLGTADAEIDDIKQVVSHPQALKQCAEAIEALALDKKELGNTAVAVKYAADLNDKSVAAIGSLKAAESYGLKVLKSGLATSANNTTRFVSVSAKPKRAEGADKISVVFIAEHVSGSLSRVLAPFAATGMNLTKIESMPIAQTEFEYMFYADLKGDITDPRVAGVLATLKERLPLFDVLGNYKEENITIK